MRETTKAPATAERSDLVARHRAWRAWRDSAFLGYSHEARVSRGAADHLDPLRMDGTAHVRAGYLATEDGAYDAQARIMAASGAVSDARASGDADAWARALDACEALMRAEG